MPFTSILEALPDDFLFTQSIPSIESYNSASHRTLPPYKVLPKPPALCMVALPEKKRFAGAVFQYFRSFANRHSGLL